MTACAHPAAVTRAACAATIFVTVAAMVAMVAAGPAHADPADVYAPGSTVTLVAHVAGLDAPLATVPLDGFTGAQASAAVAATEAAIARRHVALVAVPVHGKRSTTRVTIGSVLAKPSALQLVDPASLTTRYNTVVRLALSAKSVSALAAKLVKPTTVAPVNASARLAAHLILSKGYNGSTLDPTHLPLTLIKAMARGSAVLPEKPVAAEYGAATLRKVIVVSTSANTLKLYVKGKLAQTFVVATGQAGYPSPHGSFHVIEREPAPTWTNPEDPWSLSLPKVIGPGPDNPLGTRALQLDSPGILIHGIPEAENATLGENASHGCVRMARSEIEKLYPEIPVGTPVLLTS